MSHAMPGVRPAVPHFSSGPCAKRPGWSLSALTDAVLGRSHRSKIGRAKLKRAIHLTREVLEVPADYRIGIVPASDTGAVEMALWSMLGARPVTMLAWESFGEGWVSETLLYQVVRRVYAGHEVLRRDRPSWLGGLELDIHVPELHLAFEYQGQQHYHPVAAWGGAEALASVQERDRRKAAACAARHVMLVAIDYTEPLTEDHVRARVACARQADPYPGR